MGHFEVGMQIFSWWCHEQCSLGVDGTSGLAGSVCGDVNATELFEIA